MECIILDYCSLGVLPADLMRPIVLQSNWKGAMAVALSCKYWYKEFRDKVVHPMIAIMMKDEWWMFRRGQIYGTQAFGSNAVKDQEFRTIMDIIRFKEQYNACFLNEERIKRRTEHESTTPTLMKIREVNGEESLIVRDNKDNSLKISLVESFINDDVIYSETNPKFLDDRPGNVIKIDICNSISPSTVLEVYVDIWGHIRYSYIRCKAGTSTNFELKRDPKLFFDLRDILVYPKHAKAVVFPKEQKDEDHRSFRATYVSHDAKKTYQIQHLIVTRHWKEEVLSVVTNDYKKDAMTKIIRLVSTALTGSLNRFEMNDWASTTELASPWNPLLIQPIKLQSSLKDENISSIHYMMFCGRTSKTAKMNRTWLQVTFDGQFSLDIYERNRKNQKITVYEKDDLRYPNIKKLQQFFNDFETIEKVRNSRDNTEKSYKKLDEKERVRIEKGKITQDCHSVPHPFCGSTIISASYRPFYLKDSCRTCPMSPQGFEFAWKFIMEAISEIDLLPK